MNFGQCMSFVELTRLMTGLISYRLNLTQLKLNKAPISSNFR